MTVEKPWELAEAELILNLCERFHCLPSELYAEPSSLLLLLNIERLGNKNE